MALLILDERAEPHGPSSERAEFGRSILVRLLDILGAKVNIQLTV